MKVEDGVVTDLIVVANSDCGGGAFPASEPIGQAFIASLAAHNPRLQGEWFQTSYNTHRGLYYTSTPEFELIDGEWVSVNGSPEGGFRWEFAQIGYRFLPDVGEYGEFREMESI